MTILADQLDTDILTFLARHERKRLLRFVTVGSVDDGKSTLIGRLLHDTDGVYEDQLADARTVDSDGVATIDFARITDGLRAEREQGITIDVAYRYFTTPARKYIIADTPGHIQYTRNMATGASTAHVAIILIDARLGVLQQSRRHAYIASLLGIPHLLVAINKMDLVDFEQPVFESIRDDFAAFAEDLAFEAVTFIPMSALNGDNVVERSERTTWFEGHTLLSFLETVDIPVDDNLEDFRYPVQFVIRPHQDYRGFAGQIASGCVSVGDEVMVLPSGKTSRIEGIDTWEGELEGAHAPMSVTIRLEDEIDCSRGDMIVKTDDVPLVVRRFEAMLVWMSEQRLDPARQYLIKQTTRYVRVVIDDVLWMKDLNTLEEVEAASLGLNDIGCVAFTAHQPIYPDAYPTNHSTGAFIVIDALTNDTVAAGMIQRVLEGASEGDADGDDRADRIGSAERVERLAQAGTVVWVTGEGAAEVAGALDRSIFAGGWLGYVVDSADPAFGLTGSAAGEVALAARHLARAGVVAIALPGTGTVASLEEARATVGADRLVHVEATGAADPESAAASIIADLRSREVLRDR